MGLGPPLPDPHKRFYKSNRMLIEYRLQNLKERLHLIRQRLVSCRQKILDLR